MLAVSPVETRRSREVIARDLGTTLLSRKRKLSELYSITTSTEIDNDSNTGLAYFLEQNDLRKGRYFLDSRLPARHYHAPTPTSTRPDSTSSAPSADASEDAVTRPLSPESAEFEQIATHQTSPVPAVAEHDMVARTRARDNSSSVQSLQTKDQHEGNNHIGKLTGVIIEQRSQPGPPKRSQQRLLHQQSRTNGRGSRPVSPPYSPQESTDDGTLQNVSETENSKHLSVPNPQKEERDSRHKSPRRSERQRGKTAEVQEVSEDEKAPGSDGQPQRSPRHMRGIDSMSPPSSVTGQRSNVTGENVEDSPATSPDEGSHETQESIKNKFMDESSNKENFKSNASAPKSTTHVLDPSQSTGPEPVTENGNIKPPPERGSDSVSVSMTNVAKDANARIVESHLTSTEDTVAKKVKDESLLETSPLGPVTAAKSTVHQPTGDLPRGRKRKRTSVESPSTFVLYKPRSDRFLSTAKSVRENRYSQGGHLPLLKGGYIAPLALRVALKSVFPTDLEHLMKNTSKTVTTTDWMTYHREEHNKRIFDRIIHLQNTDRWSLRQLKRSVEPPQQISHWDFLLQDVKWLQIDFREERKLKIAIAKQLADACANYVASRSDLGEGSDRTKDFPRPVTNSPLDEAGNESEGIAKSNNEQMFQDSDDESGVFSSANPILLQPGARCKLSERSLKHIPVLHSSLANNKNIASQAQLPSSVSPFGSETNRHSSVKQCYREVLRPDEGETVQPTILPPEDTSCALFDPEWKGLRSRLNQQWPWKPPSNTMPPQSYYELRHASQWTVEDDVMLRQFVKESPSNWNLIADRMNAKTSVFKSNIERRTPWECYERLLGMEGTPSDAQARQYLRPFHYRLERAQHDFETRQREMQERVLEDAKKHGSPPNLPHKRFPTPMRVERKPNKRFLALLDGARKLARKRENTAMKQQQNAQQQEVQAHRSGLGRTTPGTGHTPAYFSQLKATKEQKEAEKVKMIQEAQRAAYEQARRAQNASGQQAQLPNGVAPQMRANLNGQLPSSTHLAVPVSSQGRLGAAQGGSAQGAMPNGVVSTSQAVTHARAQSLIQAHQRMAALNGQSASSPEMQRLMAQMQQNGMQQFRNSQQQLQGQARGSPNMANLNNRVESGTFNNMANSGDGLQSPGVQLNGGSVTTSPNLAQQFQVPTAHSPQAQSNSAHGHSASLPQSLSSGHIPMVANLQAQIARSNPQMSPQEVSKMSAEQLRQMLASHQSRPNAHNATSGMGHGNLGNLSSSGQGAFPHQRHPSHPPNAGSPQLHGSSPYMTASLLNSNHQSTTGRPGAAVANGVDPSAQQRYSQEVINRMMSQQHQQRQQQLGIATAAAAGLHSPAIGNANLAMNGMQGFAANGQRTPGQGMRPPSRSMASGMEGQQLQRPGSAQSPRPLSASGFTG